MRRKSGSMAVRNFLSLLFFLGSLAPPLPARRRPASRTLTPPPGPVVGIPVRPNLGGVRRAFLPLPRPRRGLLQPSPRPQHASTPAGAGAGARPQRRPPPLPGFPASLPHCLLVFFCVDSELCWCVSSCPLAVGCPS